VIGVLENSSNANDDLTAGDQPLSAAAGPPPLGAPPELRDQATSGAESPPPEGARPGDEPVAESPEGESVVIEPPIEVEETVEDVQPLEELPISDEPPQFNWYILKVQSNREESIADGLRRRVAMAGLDRYFGDVIVPTETVTEFKAGKKRVVKRKLYPGYIVVQMEINDDTWFLVRETPGIGDFTGSAGKPSPMLPQEIAKIVSKHEEKGEEAPKLKIAFRVGDRVKVNEGTFENFEGEVGNIEDASGRVTVMINIFGRSTPVEVDYWQIEAV
jgi:transcriptional antiterminator NusG